MAGYDSTALSRLGVQQGYGFGLVVSTREVYVPPTRAIAGTPGVPPTATTVKLKKNKGWNSRARSVNPLIKGQYIIFNCNTGIEGCCIGIGAKSRRRTGISDFTHSIVSDLHGIKIYEDGQFVKLLKNSTSAISFIRVYRADDESIIYIVTTESDSISYSSLVKNTLVNPYIFGHIYSAGDAILSASYETGKVVHGGF